MTHAEIPGVVVWPPFLFGVAAVAVLLLNWFLPMPIAPRPFGLWLGAALLAGGAALNAWGSLVMRNAGTNINPSQPAKTLVASGPFRVSRNPLYVGASLMLLGLSLALNSLWGFLALVPVLLVMHYDVILREERYLERKFGDTYRQYRSTVRRYL